MFLTIVLLIAGLILLVYGSDRLVYGAAVFSQALRIPPFIIGLIIMGIGTSLPELMVSVTASLDGLPNMAVGNAIGSNITNLLLITGAAALIRPITVQSEVLRRELPLMLLITAFAGYLIANNYLSRLDGILLLFTALFFISVMIKIIAGSPSQTDDANGTVFNKNKNTVDSYAVDSYTRERNSELPVEANKGIALLWVVLGLIILPISTRIVIDNASTIAHTYGISDLVIGLTILSVGTSLPELATSVAAAIKGENDIAMGNIIGSNIFNITLVLGVPSLFSPSVISSYAFTRDFWVMMAASVLFTIFCLRRKHQLNRLNGALLLCGFIAYFVVLFVMPGD